MGLWILREPRPEAGGALSHPALRYRFDKDKIKVLECAQSSRFLAFLEADSARKSLEAPLLKGTFQQPFVRYLRAGWDRAR